MVIAILGSPVGYLVSFIPILPGLICPVFHHRPDVPICTSIREKARGFPKRLAEDAGRYNLYTHIFIGLLLRLSVLARSTSSVKNFLRPRP